MTNNQKTISRLTLHSHTGRVSVLTSVKGSITIEASMAIPIFVFAVICLLYLLEIMSVQVSVRSGMQYAGKILAQDASTLTVMIPSEVEKDIVNTGVWKIKKVFENRDCHNKGRVSDSYSGASV